MQLFVFHLTVFMSDENHSLFDHSFSWPLARFTAGHVPFITKRIQIVSDNIL